jgi:hypothetical protein
MLEMGERRVSSHSGGSDLYPPPIPPTAGGELRERLHAVAAERQRFGYPTPGNTVISTRKLYHARGR